MNPINTFIQNYFEKDRKWYNSLSYIVFNPNEIFTMRHIEEIEMEQEMILKYNLKYEFYKILKIFLGGIIVSFFMNWFNSNWGTQFIIQLGVFVFIAIIIILHKTTENIDSLTLNQDWIKLNNETIKWDDINTFRVVSQTRYFIRPYSTNILLFIFLKNGRVLIRDITEIPIPKSLYSNEYVALTSYIQYYSKIKE